MKKKSLIALASLTLATGLLIAGCTPDPIIKDNIITEIVPDSGTVEQYPDMFPEYGFENEVVVSKPVPDAGIVLDGKADEAFWAGQKEYVTTSVRENRREGEQMYDLKDATVSSKSYFTENGVYLYFDVDDHWFKLDPGGNIYASTAVEIYFSRDHIVDPIEQIYELTFAIDGEQTARKYRKGNPLVKEGFQNFPVAGMTSAVDLRGGEIDVYDPTNKVTAENTNGYGIEVYIPWISLGAEGKEDAVRMAVALIRKDKGDNTIWELCSQQEGAVWAQPQTWMRFDDGGYYTLPSTESFSIYKNNAYSGGFDFSQDTKANVEAGTQKLISTIQGSPTQVFFRKTAENPSNKVFIETEISNVSIANGDKWPKVGLRLNATDKSNKTFKKEQYFMVDMSADGQTINQFISTVKGETASGGIDWMYSGSNYRKDVANSAGYSVYGNNKVKIGMYRDGETTTFYVNGYEVSSVSGYWTADELCYGGIYSFNTSATYTGYAAYVGDEAANYAATMKTLSSKGLKMDGKLTEEDTLFYEAMTTGYTSLQPVNQSTDGSGRKFTAKAVYNENGFYLYAEVDHKVYLSPETNSVVDTWWKATNVEVYLYKGSKKVQLWATAFGEQSGNFFSKLATSYDQSTGLYHTTAEIFLPALYADGFKDDYSDFVLAGISFRSGLDGDSANQDNYSGSGNPGTPFIWFMEERSAYNISSAWYVTNTGIERSVTPTANTTVTGKVALPTDVVNGYGETMADMLDVSKTKIIFRCGSFSYETTADAQGNFTVDVAAGFTYDVTYSCNGLKETVIPDVQITAAKTIDPVTLEGEIGFGAVGSNTAYNFVMDPATPGRMFANSNGATTNGSSSTSIGYVQMELSSEKRFMAKTTIYRSLTDFDKTDATVGFVIGDGQGNYANVTFCAAGVRMYLNGHYNESVDGNGNRLFTSWNTVAESWMWQVRGDNMQTGRTDITLTAIVEGNFVSLYVDKLLMLRVDVKAYFSQAAWNASGLKGTTRYIGVVMHYGGNTFVQSPVMSVPAVTTTEAKINEFVASVLDNVSSVKVDSTTTAGSVAFQSRRGSMYAIDGKSDKDAETMSVSAKFTSQVGNAVHDGASNWAHYGFYFTDGISDIEVVLNCTGKIVFILNDCWQTRVEVAPATEGMLNGIMEKANFTLGVEFNKKTNQVKVLFNGETALDINLSAVYAEGRNMQGQVWANNGNKSAGQLASMLPKFDGRDVRAAVRCVQDHDKCDTCGDVSPYATVSNIAFVGNTAAQA